MITEEKIQAAFARTRSLLTASNPSAASSCQGQYLRVLPIAGFAKYPIKVQLLGSKIGRDYLIFYGPEFQLADCDSARVTPQAFADTDGAGETVFNGVDVGFTGAAIVDSDTKVNPSAVFSNQKIAPVNKFLNGLFAFQWSRDLGEVSANPSTFERRGMVPVFLARLGGAASAATAINFQNFSPLWNVGGLANYFAMIGCGYSVIRHIFGGSGLADGVIVQKWFADPWAYDAGPAPVKAGQLVLDTSSRFVDESINMPQRPGWIYLTTEIPNITWTLEVS